jgi:adenylate cyclase
LLSGDHAFKQAVATHDHGTILSALGNQTNRIGANVMMLLTMEQRVIADTLHPDLKGSAFIFPELIELAEDNERGEASDIHAIADQPYQLVVVPLFAPAPIAWIVIGYSIADSFAQEIQNYTRSEVSLITELKSETPVIAASTLADNLRPDLLNAISHKRWMVDANLVLVLAQAEYVSLVSPVWQEQENDVVVVLQRSLAKALQPHLELRKIMFFVFIAGLVLSVVSGGLLARSVTRPVRKLAAGAQRIGQGDYTQRVDVTQNDELGALATSFNEMAAGLVDRDRVRNLLGKIVSPEVAQELLSKDIELGGEEREATILFVDIREFTTLCENRSPTEILDLLNNYLTHVSGVIEEHGGVVDKYIGDAVMALFGAPLHHEDDPARAVESALNICLVLKGFNENLIKQGTPELRIGIGVNSGLVVAGNMGSITRLNYTVIGDTVNLAARLEGLTKVYGVEIIVSQSTMESTQEMVYRQLDRVRVKGKQEPVNIYQPMGLKAELSADLLQERDDFHAAFSLYQKQSWAQALTGFQALASASPCILYALYINRCLEYQQQPPGPEWDGTTNFQTK